MITLALVSVLLVQCGTAPTPPAPSPPAATPPPSVKTSPSPTASLPHTTPPPTVQPVTAAELGPSWRPGCPIDPQRLRKVEVTYLGFDGQTHRGELIVNEDLAAE